MVFFPDLQPHGEPQAAFRRPHEQPYSSSESPMQVVLVLAILSLLLWTLLPAANHTDVEDLTLDSTRSTVQRFVDWLQH